MSNPVEIGVRIQNQRKLLGMSREQLAEILDITPRFCYDLELGHKGMSISTLCKISTALNVSTDFLLFGNPTNEPYLAESISIFQTCPTEKRHHLNKIMSEFIQAVKK